MPPPITKIRLENIQFNAPIGYDAWGRPSKPTQPVSASISVRVNLTKEDHASDDLTRSLDYSKLASLVIFVGQNPDKHATTTPGRWEHVLSFHMAVRNALQPLPDVSTPRDYPGITRDIRIDTVLPVGTLGAGATATWSSLFGLMEPFSHTEIRLLGGDEMLDIANIHANTIIGIKEHEKSEKQSVLISVRMGAVWNFESPALKSPPSLAHEMVHAIVSTVEKARVETVEALVEILWDVFSKRNSSPMKLKVVKPDAVGFVGGAGVELEVLQEDRMLLGVDRRRWEMDDEWRRPKD